MLLCIDMCVFDKFGYFSGWNCAFTTHDVPRWITGRHREGLYYSFSLLTFFLCLGLLCIHVTFAKFHHHWKLVGRFQENLQRLHYNV